jgi:ornithine carbamoyltransferase
MRHLLTIHDLTVAEVENLIDLGIKMKASPQLFAKSLDGLTLGMIFQKSSTRTRVSFEVGMHQLGGAALFLSSNDLQLGRGEPISDTAQVLSRYLDAIMIRTFDHQDVCDMARFGTVPVINGLDDWVHPCQVLCDLMTIREHLGGPAGLKLAYVGDGNNMAHSLLFGGAKTGMDVTVAAPHGYWPCEKVMELSAADAETTGATLKVVTDPAEAIADADVVYTDVWASMGQEEEQAKREADFAGFTIDNALMAGAKDHAIFMHCLPAHRGEEVAAEVIDGPQSVIFDEAENRMHIQKAILHSVLR